MVDKVNSDKPKEPDLSHYKPQYQIDVAKWRSYLKFHNVQLTDKEVHAMADGFIKFTTDFMNRLMKHALEQMKEREQREKEEKGS